jgi:hypothetical protein
MGGLLHGSAAHPVSLAIDPELDALVEQILTAEKEISGSMRWSKVGRADYATCRLRVICRSHPRAYLRLVLTAKTRWLPQKSSFTLLFGDNRIFSLDVEPRRSHNNGLLGKVKCTHWATWPCTVVEPDDRQQTHRAWFDDLLKRSNSIFVGRYRFPPYEPEQMQLI